jgi:putative transposase
LPQACISDATFYKWKAKYGGLEVSDARRLKALEDENAKLKKVLAEAMLNNAMLKDIASKKSACYKLALKDRSTLWWKYCGTAKLEGTTTIFPDAHRSVRGGTGGLEGAEANGTSISASLTPLAVAAELHGDSVISVKK